MSLEKDNVCIVMNLEHFGVSQYSNYPFNSLCVFNSQLLGANEDGIFVLSSGNTDNDVEIDAEFELAESDLGIYKDKRIRSLQIGGIFSGNLEVSVKADGSESEYALLSPGISGLKYGNSKVAVNWENKGRYFGVKVANVNGSDFSIDSISGLVTVTNLPSKTNDVIGRANLVINLQ